MLIQVTEKGLRQINPLLDVDGNEVTQAVRGERRYYFGGSDPTIPVILVAFGGRPKEGEIWEASSGNEVGYPGFCLPEHEGKQIGKLTLRYTVHAALALGYEVVDLEDQINYFVRRFSFGA